MKSSGRPYDLVVPPAADGRRSSAWLADGLRSAILGRRLTGGTRLPATRELARTYGIARGTVVRAFEELEAEGYVETRAGAGTFVCAVLPDRYLQTAAPEPVTTRASAGDVRLTDFVRCLPPLGRPDPWPPRAFRRDLPAIDLLPTTLWSRLAARRLRAPGHAAFLSGSPAGFAALRRAIAGYAGAARGVRCTADDVVIVSGTQAALDLVARVLLARDDRVVMEHPGYEGAYETFVAAGAHVTGVAVDDEGMSVPRHDASGTRLVYVTPGHQYPLGITMSLRRRLALLAWARTAGALVFEDDYDGEFRYAGRPMPAMQGLDPDVVLYVGSFSKVLFPSLRLGYVIAPPPIAGALVRAISLTQRRLPLLEQMVLADFIEQGHFARHLRRMREVYAERLTTLLEHADARLAGAISLSRIEAGLQTIATVEPSVDIDELVRVADEYDVELCSVDLGGRRGLQLGFAAVAPTEIRRGVRELARAYERIRR